jgi:hypothetical protein
MRVLRLALVSLILTASVFALDTEPQNILIVELQTGSPDSASQEFIELHNPSDLPVDLADWLLQYRSASGENWTTKVVLTDIVEPRGRYLVATSEYLEEEATDVMSSGLAATGGHIRLVQPAIEEDGEDVTHDLLGWGTAEFAEGELATDAPEKGESLKRVVDEDGYFIDTDVNFDDFEISETPSPAHDEEPAEKIIDDTTDDEQDPDDATDDEVDDSEDSTDSEEEEGDQEEQQEQEEVIEEEVKTYLPINITELYIDPVSPETDADDEFIELFNPNKTAVDLEGYLLETGNNYTYSFEFPSVKINPGAYIAFYSIDTDLALSNSGSKARLTDPNGKVISETKAYEKAKAGQAWALASGTWQWTTSPTPSKANVIILPASKTSSKSSSSSKKSSSSSKSSTKGASTSSDDERNVYEEPATLEDTELNQTVLVGVGSMAVTYGLYEYRTDIGNRVYQFKKYARGRRQNRK